MDVSVVVGNPKPQSRTLQIALDVAARVLGPDGGEPATVVDLIDHASEAFDWASERMTALASAVGGSHVAVFASPTYKASYTGLLKAFLDRYPGGSLTNLVAIPVMTGGSLAHSMAVDVHLRSVLVELGASLPTSGVYFVTGEAELARQSEILDEWAARNAAILDSIRSRAR